MSRNPAVDAVNGAGPPVWSVAVPGVLRGDTVRVELVNGRAFVEVMVPSGRAPARLLDVTEERLVVELPLAELRALVGVVAQWPGVVR